MDNAERTLSTAFQVFLKEAVALARAWMEAVQALDAASALDAKTSALSIDSSQRGATRISALVSCRRRDCTSMPTVTKPGARSLERRTHLPNRSTRAVSSSPPQSQ